MNYPFKKKLIIITGHYGSGKTNLAVNLALDLAAQGKKVKLVDFDTVNPFFRSADNRELLEQNGITAILPPYANTNVDIPALSAEIHSCFVDDGADHAIFDVGGEDTGATALGAYLERIEETGYEMLYVVNFYRPNTATPEEAAALLRAIERTSGLKASGMVNNSNVGVLTKQEHLDATHSLAARAAVLAGIPLAFTSAMGGIVPKNAGEDFYALKNVTKTLF